MTNKLNVKIRSFNNFFKNLKILFIIIPFFEPEIAIKVPVLNYLFFAAMIIILLIILFKKKFILSELPKVFWFVLLYRIIIVFSTVLFKGDILKSLFYTVDFLGIFIILYYAYKNNELKKMLYAIIFLFGVYLLINLITVILYPNSIIDGLYFLGIRTRFTDFALTTIVLSLYCIVKNYKLKPFLVIVIFLALVNIYIKWIATALVGLIIMMITILVLYSLRKIKIHISYKFLFYLSLILMLLVVVFKIQYVFSFFITDVLHKSLSLSNRTLLWNRSWSYMKDSLIIGHGMNLNNGNFVWNNWEFMQGHNQVIQSLYETGIVGTLFLYLFVRNTGDGLRVYRRGHIILLSGLFAFLIMMISEIYFFYAPCWLLFIIVYYIAKDDQNDYQKSYIK